MFIELASCIVVLVRQASHNEETLICCPLLNSAAPGSFDSLPTPLGRTFLPRALPCLPCIWNIRFTIRYYMYTVQRTVQTSEMFHLSRSHSWFIVRTWHRLFFYFIVIVLDLCRNPIILYLIIIYRVFPSIDLLSLEVPTFRKF